jgi:sugar (pentulose or hexulose) kinase
MKQTILSIDCGTQSLRAILFDDRGQLIDKIKIDYEPYFSKNPGWAEQDASVYWKALCDACKALRKKDPQLFLGIAGMGVTAIRDTMINIDRDGKPIRPAITWLDQRKAKQTFHPRGIEKLLYTAIGMLEPMTKTHVDGKSNWLRQNQPEIWGKTHKYLQVSSYLNFKLTGEFKDSLASQIGHVPFDYKNFKWSDKNGLSMKMFPVETSKLVDITEPSAMLGTVTKEASKETGIPSGTPVVACGSDKGCETIGSGVIYENIASLSFGTTGTIQATSRRYYEPIQFMPPYPAAIPGHYNPEVQLFRGYWMIRWFINEFGSSEIHRAKKEGKSPEMILDEYLKDVPPGSLGLTVQPFWSPGLTFPSAKGAMIGFGDVHKKPHIYRAIIEGLGFGLYDGLLMIEKAGKTKIDKLTVSGGGSQSDSVCQITADIFNLPILRGATFETAGLGAAVITAVGTGIHPDYEVAIGKMTRVSKTFRPDAANASLYRRLYEKVYSNIYKQLKPLYNDIREITGYPEKV